MTKRQKILLTLFLAMFIVPEVLWSPVGNMIYAFITDHAFRNGFLMNSDNRGWLIFVNSLQFFGVIASIVTLLASSVYKTFRNGRALLILVSFIALINLVVLYAIIASYGFWS